MGHPLEHLVEHWCSLIKVAKDHKKAKFGDDAERAMLYFRANVSEIWGEKNIYGTGEMQGQGFLLTPSASDRANIMPPSFRMCLAKALELVELYGPALYPLNPIREVNPRLNEGPPIELFGDPNDPFVQAQFQQIQQQVQVENVRKAELARVLARYLNYTPNELGLKHDSRRVIDEAIVKGMGMWWHELYSPYEGATPLVGSFYRSIDDLLLDPDEREKISDCRWIAVRCTEPYWEVAKKYGIDEDYLKQHALKDTAARSAELENTYDAADRRLQNKASDLIEYWKIFTKCGIGEWHVNEQLREKFPPMRKYSYMVVCKGVPYPLNMPKEKFNDIILQGAETGDYEALHDAFEWPVPFWADGRWPFTPLMFHPQPNCVWPVSHLKPGLGLLNFLNWCLGFLASKVRTSCTTHVGVLKVAGEELKQRLFSGNDFVLLELEEVTGGRNVNDIVSFLQAPPMNSDIWKMVEWVMSEFEKAIGVNELLYGNATTQSRSAEDIKVRAAQSTARVDDMRNAVEDSETHLARSEALMCRFMLTAQDVAPILGQADALVWQMLVEGSDVETVVRELDYRIESDSARKPNRQQKLAALSEFGQIFAPLLAQFATGGAVGPWNAYQDIWAKLNDFPSDQGMKLPEPDPNQPDPAQQQMQAEMQMEEQRLQMEMAKLQAEMGMKQQDAQLKAAESQAKLETDQQKAMLDIQAKIAELQMKQQEFTMNARAQATKGAIDIRQKQIQTQQQIDWNAVEQAWYVRKEHAKLQADLAKKKAGGK